MAFAKLKAYLGAAEAPPDDALWRRNGEPDLGKLMRPLG
jgi:hypothetical protein